MPETAHLIRLVAGVEIRAPDPAAGYWIGRGTGERIAEDLAGCVPEVVEGRLVIGPALLEPGQVLSPEDAPWQSLAAPLQQAPDKPGVTSLDARHAGPPESRLAPLMWPPQGLFVCVPMVLAAPPARRDAVASRLEQRLFDTGGLAPPAMGRLAEASGLDPVHGQLMTETDLMALVKMQLAGAGLEPFWPPVEHALVAAGEPAELELPAGLAARWNPSARGWELTFRPPPGPDGFGDYALWLRAFRQTAALLETHRIRWRARSDDPRLEIDPRSRWVRQTAAAERPPGPGTALRIEHPDLGLIGYAVAIDGPTRWFYPLGTDAIAALERKLKHHGVERYETAGPEALPGAGPDEPETPAE